MNKEGKEKVKEAIEKLDESYLILENLLSEEEEKFDNIPEQLQEGEPAQAIQNAIDSLNSAMSSLDDSRASLEEI